MRSIFFFVVKTLIFLMFIYWPPFYSHSIKLIFKLPLHMHIFARYIFEMFRSKNLIITNRFTRFNLFWNLTFMSNTRALVCFKCIFRWQGVDVRRSYKTCKWRMKNVVPLMQLNMRAQMCRHMTHPNRNRVTLTSLMNVWYI